MLYGEMQVGKKKVLDQLCNKEEYKNRIVEQNNLRFQLNKITANDFSSFRKDIKYEQFKKYINELDEETALNTMQYLFSHNIDVLRKKTRPVKVGFLVYSKAEWKSEKLYRFIEKDSEFDPWIVLCGFGYDNENYNRKTYIDTCESFRKSGNYQIEYMGYCNRYIQGHALDKYDILFYYTPNEVLLPLEMNLQFRSIRSIVFYDPYGTYFDNKEVAYYQKSYFDRLLSEISWRLFANDRIYKGIKIKENDLQFVFREIKVQMENKNQ